MFKAFFWLLSFLIITACSASYEKLKTVDSRSNNSFAKNLLENYKEKATYEAEEMHDWNTVKLYSEKALESLRKIKDSNSKHYLEDLIRFTELKA